LGCHDAALGMAGLDHFIHLCARAVPDVRV
jgi:hypothetical protein